VSSNHLRTAYSRLLELRALLSFRYCLTNQVSHRLLLHPHLLTILSLAQPHNTLRDYKDVCSLVRRRKGTYLSSRSKHELTRSIFQVRFVVQLLFHRDPTATLNGFVFEGRTPKACNHTLLKLKSQYVTNYAPKTSGGDENDDGDDGNVAAPETPVVKRKGAKAGSTPKKNDTPKDGSTKKRKAAGGATASGKKLKKGDIKVDSDDDMADKEGEVKAEEPNGEADVKHEDEDGQLELPA
jgi:hypothetical protein